MYLGEDKFGLQPLWAEVFSIYLEFREICERHGLKHYVAYGTCLGAIRHHGFIPWDDDFDVIMPRADYERFKDLSRGELPKHLKFVDWRNAKSFAPATYGKIQNCDRDCVESIQTELGRELPHGVYIDIFPMDGAPRKRVMLALEKFKAKLIYAAMSSFCGIFTKKRVMTCCWRGLGFIVRKVCRISSLEDVAEKFDAIARRYLFESHNLCGCIFSPYGFFRDLCSFEAYGDGIEVPFGDTTVLVPQNSDSYLRMLYGDYMRLPPEERRIPSHSKLPQVPWKFGPTEN